MNLLTMENITKSYTDKVLLQRVSFGLNEGDRVGVIGVNGTGKSTLLKIIAGREEPDGGTVVKGGKVRIEFLSQTPEFNGDESVLRNVTQGKQAEESHWNLEGQAASMLAKLGISDVSQPVRFLSGGQKKRAALVRALLLPADILVLDEPTNHLDNEMSEWLEDKLNAWKGAFVMVTHDRYFLDRVTNRIVEIDQGNLYSYAANYREFLELKTQREEMELATERKKQALYRQDLEWMMRGARARSTKQKAHIERFEELKDREKPTEEKQVVVNTLSSRLGKKTMEAAGISKAYGEKKLITDFSCIFLKGSRVGIIGKNGCGKSTLLKILCRQAEPDSGEVRVGDTVKVGYFSQENEAMDDNCKVLDYIRDTAEYIMTSEGQLSASAMCERFLFEGALKQARIGKLSGGEKRRLYLLKILMDSPNVLMLDEPTNDLDIQTLTILEDYLTGYDGIVIAVSHDRYFLDKMATRILAFEENGTIASYEGNYSDYREKNERKREEKQEPEQAAGARRDAAGRKKPRSGRERLRFTYQEQREFDEIDDVIASMEEKIAALEKKMEENASSYGKLGELMQEKEELEQSLEEKMDRWVYLNDLAEQMKNQ